ncbi:MAG: hypothetical protein ABL998_03760 [Planctomycetota bacterium]
MLHSVLIVVCVLVALVSPSSAQAVSQSTSRPLVLRFDAAEARAEGWVAADASDEDVRAAQLAFVRWRLTAAGREHELVPTATGAEVRVPERDPRLREAARGLLAQLGVCEFYLLAEEDDVPDGRHRPNRLQDDRHAPSSTGGVNHPLQTTAAPANPTEPPSPRQEHPHHGPPAHHGLSWCGVGQDVIRLDRLSSWCGVGQDVIRTGYPLRAASTSASRNAAEFLTARAGRPLS